MALPILRDELGCWRAENRPWRRSQDSTAHWPAGGDGVVISLRHGADSSPGSLERQAKNGGLPQDPPVSPAPRGDAVARHFHEVPMNGTCGAKCVGGSTRIRTNATFAVSPCLLNLFPPICQKYLAQKPKEFYKHCQSGNALSNLNVNSSILIPLMLPCAPDNTINLENMPHDNQTIRLIPLRPDNAHAISTDEVRL
jgi:hypothetical protein